MTRSFKTICARVFVIATVWSCAMPVGDPEDDVTPSAAALTAGDHGMELMLPFPAGTSRTLTRAYMGDVAECTPSDGEPRRTSHCRYAPGLWDDRYALDFAGDGCESWRAPVLASAEGRVVIPPDTGGNRARSYGAAEVAIDHGNGCVSHYAHLDARIVTDGQLVRQGETVGYEGNRGNVSGAACPEHPGTHLHFKVVCEGVSVKPEPLSGYRDLGSHVGKRFAHRALHHPSGTLVKTADDPRIYLVCDDEHLCHVRDERAWRAWRFFQDARDEWATVVIVDDDEIACHDAGPEIVDTPRISASACGGATFVAYDDGRVRWRRQVPFEPSQAGYRILLRSWGFRLDEVAQDDISCDIPLDPARPNLALRDGTVIEEATEDDFFIIADDGTAFRLYRNLLPVLYGDRVPQVIQVPTGSVPTLVRTVSHAHTEFTVTDATTCPNGRHHLAPGFGESYGGGAAEEAPEMCEPESEDVPNGITCVRHADSVSVHVSGPVGDLLVGPLPERPVAVGYGADGDGWSTARESVPWNGEGEYTLHVPLNAGRFNLYVRSDAGVVAWFDLPDADGDGDAWTVDGDCRMQCGTDSCALAF